MYSCWEPDFQIKTLKVAFVNLFGPDILSGVIVFDPFLNEWVSKSRTPDKAQSSNQL